VRIKNLFLGFMFTFPLVLVVSGCVGYCYSLIVHGIGVTYWLSSFHLAIILGITLPWIHEWEKHTLIRLDKSLYKTLKQWASDDLRSVNAQIESLLLDAVRNAGRWKTESDSRKNK
jgi:hypothetical protein